MRGEVRSDQSEVLERAERYGEQTVAGGGADEAQQLVDSADGLR